MSELSVTTHYNLTSLKCELVGCHSVESVTCAGFDILFRNLSKHETLESVLIRECDIYFDPPFMLTDCYRCEIIFN